MKTEAEIIEKLKHNTVGYKWLSEEEKKVLNKYHTNVVFIYDNEKWVYEDIYPYNNTYIYRIHQDFQLPTEPKLQSVTIFEVISATNGRLMFAENVQYDIQDDGKTLKVFIK